MKFLDRFRFRQPVPAAPAPLVREPLVLPVATPAPAFAPTDSTHHEIIVDDTPDGLFSWIARVYHHQGPTVEKLGTATTHADAVTLAGAWANKEMEV